MAYEFVPVDLSRESFSTMHGAAAPTPQVRNLVQRLREQQIENLPQKLEDLVYTDTLSQLISFDMAVSLGLPVAGGEAAHGKWVFVQQYQRYAILQEAEERVLFGIGVRWLVDVRSTEGKAVITTLPMLTASAQLGHVTANTRFDVIGLSSEEIDRAIPAPSVLNVETHVEYARAMKAITSLMWKPDTIVRPQVLSVPKAVASKTDAYDLALGRALAVRQIASGKALNEALKNAPSSATEVVRAAYLELANIATPEQMPDEEVKKAAREKVSGWEF